MIKKIVFSTIFFLCGIAAFCFKIDYKDNVAINDAVYEDIYIAGGTVIINAPVFGDLIIAGGTIIINDTISGDILVAGGEVTFNGAVGDDIRCAGGRLVIKNNVWGHIAIAGGEVNIHREVKIGGLIISGGSVKLDGVVNGILKCYAGTLVFNGSIAKNAEISGGTIVINGSIMGQTTLAAKEVSIGNKAAFYDNIRYWTKNGEIDFKNSIKNGNVVFDKSLKFETGRWEYLGFFSALGLLWYISAAFLMILLLQYLFSAIWSKSSNVITSQSWKSFGYGFLFFVVIPIATLLLFITLIGVPIGIILLFGYITVLLFASVITALIITHWLNDLKEKDWNFWSTSLISLGVFAVLKIIGLIPIIGWIAVFIITCFAFGALLISINFKRSNSKTILAHN